MNVYLDTIHLPSVFSDSQSNILGELRSHIVSSVQVLSNYMRYNELTLAGSVLGINFGLIALSDKIMDIGLFRFFHSERLEEFLQRPWVQLTNTLLLRSIVVVSGITALNHLMKLRLCMIHIALSVVAAIALKVLWEKAIAPEINSLWGKKTQTEEKTLIDSVDIEDSDESDWSETQPVEHELVEEVEDKKKGLDTNKSNPGAQEKESTSKKEEVGGNPSEVLNQLIEGMTSDKLSEKGALSESMEEILDDQLMGEIPIFIPDAEKDIEFEGSTLLPSSGTASLLESKVFHNNVDRLKNW